MYFDQPTSSFPTIFFVGQLHEDVLIEEHPGNLTVLMSKHFNSSSIASTFLNLFDIFVLILVKKVVKTPEKTEKENFDQRRAFGASTH